MYVTLSDEAARPVVTARLAGRQKPLTRLGKGAYLYFEGDAVSHLFVVRSGVVRLTRVLEDGRRQVISFGYPGDIIGFPSNGTHRTDCDALTDARLSAIPRRALDDSSFDADLHSVLVAAAMHEIGEMQDHFMMLGRKSASERVALFLRVLLDRIGNTSANPPRVDLPMSRADIADFLGLTTETVCRCLTAMRKAGIIRLDGVSKVVVLDAQALSQKARGHLN